jgi:hypothetical protein
MERLLGLVTDGELKIAFKIYHDASDDMHGLANTAAAIQAIEMDLVACLASAETGVLSADAPLETHGVRSNGTAQLLERGNKFYMEKRGGSTYWELRCKRRPPDGRMRPNSLPHTNLILSR